MNFFDRLVEFGADFFRWQAIDIDYRGRGVGDLEFAVGPDSEFMNRYWSAIGEFRQ